MAQETLEQTGAVATPPVADQGQQGEGQVQQPEVASQEVKTVPLEAFETVRREAQEHKAELERQRMRAEILEHAAQQQQKQAPAWDPEDVPLNKDVARMVQEQVGPVQEQVRQDRLAIQEQQARMKYTDFDQVSELGIEMVKQIPGMADIVLNTPNPAEIVYNYGKTHPSYSKMQQQAATHKVTQAINQNLNQPRTLSEAGGGGAPSIQTDWRDKAGSAEMADKIAKVMGYR